MYAAEHLRPRLEARIAAAGPSIVVPERVEPSLSPTQPTSTTAGEPAEEATPTRLSGHVVLIGYGRVGSVVAEGLKNQGTPFVLIEDSEKRVAAAHAAGIEVVIGNAATPQSLSLANVAGASTLLIAIPNAFEAGQAVEQCHKLNPRLMIVARAHSDEEVEYLRGLGANEVIMGEREIGLGMLSWTNGDAERHRDADRAAASMAAVAAALKLDDLPPRAVSAPQVAPEILEAEIEAAHPEHQPAGPAEPPELVPALGEMPATDRDDGDGDAVVVAEALHPATEQFVEVPVTLGLPEPESEDTQTETAAPAEREAGRPRAGSPATTAATPFNPESTPADSDR
jgi:CPA2 family monovalent cation:H+ antiporter-2